MATDRARLILGGVIILLPLSWDEDNLWGMIHIFGMYNHVLSVVMRQRQIAGHVFKDIWYITMLWPLSWDDDNWRSMFHTLEMNNPALAVVMRWWQLTEHDSFLRGYNHTLTVVMRQWQLTEHVSYMNYIAMLWPFSWDEDNWRGMFHTIGI